MENKRRSLSAARHDSKDHEKTNVKVKALIEGRKAGKPKSIGKLHKMGIYD